MNIIPTLPPLYIVDLDGTLALVTHREHFLHDTSLSEDERWRKFFAECVNDIPNLSVLTTITLLRKAGAEIRFFSGRSDEVRDLTIRWLTTFTEFTELELRTTKMLVMRPAESRERDDVLKEQWYDELPLVDKRRLAAVLDDRQSVVDMWRRRGVSCFQVAPGDF